MFSKRQGLVWHSDREIKEQLNQEMQLLQKAQS